MLGLRLIIYTALICITGINIWLLGQIARYGTITLTEPQPLTLIAETILLAALLALSLVLLTLDITNLRHHPTEDATGYNGKF